MNSLSKTFTITPNVLFTGTIKVTPLGGKVSTSVVLTFNNSSAPQTFTITPTAVGPVKLTATNSGSLTDSAVLSYATSSAAPLIGTATPGNGVASVTFSPPVSTGGSAITSYKATCSPGNVTGTSTASPIVVSGLTNGTAYACSVTAANAFGTSAPSRISNSATPLAPATGRLFYPAQISPSVVTVTNASTVNLPSYADWRLFSGPGQGCSNAGSFDAKANGHAISRLYQTGNSNFCTSVGNYVNTLGPTRFTTSDGSQPPQTDLSSGLYGAASGDTKYILVPADDSLQTLQLWMTELQARTNVVTFHLTDNSVADNVLSTPVTMGSDGQAHLLYRVDFAAASKGQFLVVSFANANSFDQFQAATLAQPAVTPNTYNLTNGINPQYVVDFTHDADTIILVDGYSWTGTLTMPVGKAVTLRSSVNLPTGKRVSRSDVHASLIAPHDGTNTGPINIPSGARDITIDGIEIANTLPGVNNYGLIIIGPPTLGINGSYLPNVAVSDLPQDINITHCYVHGTTLINLPPSPVGDNANQHAAYFVTQTNDGIYADGNRINIRDSIISDLAWDGKEANAIKIQIGQSVNIDNNELSSNGENILLYAAGAYDNSTYLTVSNGLYPNGISISNNWLYKDLNWQFIRYTKNLIEVKNGRNIHVFNNLGEYSFEGIYSQGQHGLGFAIANRTRGGRGTGDTSAATPWATTQNVEFERNILHHMGTAFAVQGPYDDYYCTDSVGGFNGNNCTEDVIAAIATKAGATRATNWSIHDNYADDLDGGKYSNVASTPLWTNYYPSQGIRGQGGDNFRVEHNTFVFAHPTVGEVLPLGIYLGIPYGAHAVSNLDNIGLFTTRTNLDTDAKGNPVIDVGSGEKWAHTSGLFIDNNIFGAEVVGNGAVGLEALHGYSGQGWQVNIFTSNNISNAFTDWSSTLTAANAAAPGQYTGNTINTAPSGAQGVRDLSSLLAIEPSIRAGDRTSR